MPKKSLVGIGEYLKGESGVEEIIHSHSRNLDILPAGKCGSLDPDEVFSSSKFIELIQKLRQSYDRIIMDTAPVVVVSDAMQLLPLCDGAVYVVRYNSASSELINMGVSRINRSETPLLGCIINAMPTAVMQLYHYREYKHKAYPGNMTGNTDKVA